MSLLRAKSQSDQSDRTKHFWQRIQAFPLSWLHLALWQRLLIVTGSYIPAIIGLLVFFPLAHNGSSMFLPIVFFCWLFRYWGLLISLLLNGMIFQLAYAFGWQGILPDDSFVVGGMLGFVTSLGLGLIVCLLRNAVDLVQASRQRALEAERDRLLALQTERQATLAYEYQLRLNALKDDFLLHVSHEFRTPLTVLGGALELLHNYQENLDATAQSELLMQAQTNQQELTYLVERILGAATVAGDLPETHREALLVRRIVQSVLDHLDTRRVREYTFSIQIPENLQVWADQQFLHQVLQNLLQNIFNYVPAQTEVSVIATQSTSAEQVCLSVQDAGPGIPVEEAPMLFEKFVRLKRDLASSTRGTGLGLYICKRFVEAMDGSIWVESTGCAGEGSRFSLTLPSVPPPALP
ncbi:MAG TPA: ATP-binding protein [Ktedonobacteraceae bacterium]|nr:ATP-binding protein [Ktedonobacteraceae bacterium]